MDTAIVHEDLIKNALRETIERIKAGIDPEKAKAACQGQLGIPAPDEIELREGLVAVHGAQIVFKYAVKVSHNLEMLIDERGNCVIAPATRPVQPESQERIPENAGGGEAEEAEPAP